ncbi:MAG TPA: hypothetical protein VMA95_01120 [Streptosporangiaceae bacterium]|nr:hypothetical protein [Streptosporangiaceae bacterium]
MTSDPDFAPISAFYASLNETVPDDIALKADHYPYHRRVVVIVLFDLSSSMSFLIAGRRPIDLLNKRLREWLPSIRKKGNGELRDAEFAVITFSGHGVRVITGDRSRPRERAHEDGGAFVPAALLDFGVLEASGTTPMVEAINCALDLGEARVRYLADQSLPGVQVRILMFTDGEPNERDLPPGAWQAAVARVFAARERGPVQFFALGTPDADPTVLRELAGQEGYIPLGQFDFARLLDIILVASTVPDPYKTIREQFGWEDRGRG